jgi:hypothetical protein
MFIESKPSSIACRRCDNPSQHLAKETAGEISLTTLKPLVSPVLSQSQVEESSDGTSNQDSGPGLVRRESFVRAMRSLRMKSDACLGLLVGSSSWIAMQLTTAHCFECWATRLLPAALLLGVASYLHERFRRIAGGITSAWRAAKAQAENQSEEGVPVEVPSEHAP